jgi:hypothetical protein
VDDLAQNPEGNVEQCQVLRMSCGVDERRENIERVEEKSPGR